MFPLFRFFTVLRVSRLFVSGRDDVVVLLSISISLYVHILCVYSVNVFGQCVLTIRPRSFYEMENYKRPDFDFIALCKGYKFSLHKPYTVCKSMIFILRDIHRYRSIDGVDVSCVIHCKHCKACLLLIPSGYINFNKLVISTGVNNNRVALKSVRKPF